MINLWEVVGSSYNGCEGWTSWNTGKIFSSKEKAEACAEEKNKDKFSRFTVERVKVR